MNQRRFNVILCIFFRHIERVCARVVHSLLVHWIILTNVRHVHDNEKNITFEFFFRMKDRWSMHEWSLQWKIDKSSWSLCVYLIFYFRLYPSLVKILIKRVRLSSVSTHITQTSTQGIWCVMYTLRVLWWVLARVFL
jgi:hypothetical protein